MTTDDPDILIHAQVGLDAANEVANNSCISIVGLHKKLEFLLTDSGAISITRASLPPPPPGGRQQDRTSMRSGVGTADGRAGSDERSRKEQPWEEKGSLLRTGGGHQVAGHLLDIPK